MMTTTVPYTFEHLNELMKEIAPDSITSRTFYRDEHIKLVLFGFDEGQELSEHTSSHAAIIHLLSGEATITLGEDKHETGAGAWIQMSPNLAHSIYAKTPLVMLLYMFQK